MAESALAPWATRRHHILFILRMSWLPIGVIAAIVVALFFGSASISPDVVVRILAYKSGVLPVHASWPSGDEQIVWDIRLPRILAAALVGSALALAGALYQAVLRNPLADPYVIGTSAGAQLGVTIAVLLPIQFSIAGFGPLQGLAFVGALATVLFVYGLARIGGTTAIVTLILAGFVLSSFLISTTSFLMVVSSRFNQIVYWTMGGIQVSEWSQLALAAPLILVTVGIAWVLAPMLDAMLLGEEAAGNLGVPVESLKLGVIVLASVVTALAVTLAGIVAFVGLVVPHTARLLYGPGHRLLLPVSACGGAIFVVVIDVLARTLVAPTELPLGVMTAVVGAPFFLHLLRRSRRDYAI